MGFFIPGMARPKDCDECWKKYHGFGMVEHDEEWGTFYCKLAKCFCVDPRLKCPLVPVPPHGRLGDLDAFAERMEELQKQAMTDGFDLGAFWYSAFVQHIKLAPTIIPADPAEEG